MSESDGRAVSSPDSRSFYVNPAARTWKCEYTVDPAIANFHRNLPGFAPTPLVSLTPVAEELGVKHVLMKDESDRASLPSFKILGASWATYRAVIERVGANIGISLEELSELAQRDNSCLFAATDGNHGRAVARMAKLLGIGSHIFIPGYLSSATRSLIAAEGTDPTVIDGDYDYTVTQAKVRAEQSGGILIQDIAFEGYEEAPQWIVDGYSTMIEETFCQARTATGATPDLVVVPAGCGSLAQSVVACLKSKERPTTILVVEADSAACIMLSLTQGRLMTTPTGDTIMEGLNCGTPSSIAWPFLYGGVDASISVSDMDAHHSVQKLHAMGIGAGPCGGAALAAVESLSLKDRAAISLGADSTVILLCTEGTRVYEAPV